MIRIQFLGCFLLFSLPAWAQVGNEWIQPGQAYFKVPVAAEGIYRLTYNDLANAGFPMGANPNTIQLFHRGVEQSIHVEGQGDGVFDPTDFVEFYGLKNDGTLDRELYRPDTLQPHPYYNLYNDTTCYFLTLGMMPGKRMPTHAATQGALVKKDFHYDSLITLYTLGYETGEMLSPYSEFQYSHFNKGEGWIDNAVITSAGTTYTIANLLNSVPTGGDPVLKAVIVGRSFNFHHLEVAVGPPGGAMRILSIPTYSGYGFDVRRLSIPFQWTDIAPDGRVSIRFKALGTGLIPDYMGVSLIKIVYPQAYDQRSLPQKIYTLAPEASGLSYIELQNTLPGTLLYDVTRPDSIKRIGTTATTTLNAVVNFTYSKREILATNNFLTPTIKKVSFVPLVPAQYDYLIISHSLLMKPAAGHGNAVQAYADYRASAKGGGYKPLVVDIQQLFDQFSYGETTSLAIYHFLKHMSVANPKYVLLIGKGLDLRYRYYRNPTATSFSMYKDFVPSAGIPASDALFSAGLMGSTYESGIPTGRLPATNPEHIVAYLNKVMETEALPYNDLWRKDLLHLSGGIEEGEPERFRSYILGFENVAEGFHLGGNAVSLGKKSRDANEKINISNQVNLGKSLVTFFGHSSPTTLDFDIGFVTDPKMGYSNKGKYPMFLINGCEVGQFFYAMTLLGEDWINAPNKGAKGFIAHSFYGDEITLKNYSDVFYSVAFADSLFIKKGIGDIMKETSRRYLASVTPDMLHISQAEQMLLLGDPALNLFGAKKPDYEINDNNIYLQSFNNSPITSRSDSMALKVIVRNFGMAVKDTFRIEVTRTLNDNSTVVYDSLFPPVLYSDTLTLVIKNGKFDGAGNNSFKVTLDPDQLIPELNENNNVAILGKFIPLYGTKNLFPHDFAIVNTPSVNLTFQTDNLLSGERQFLVEVDTVDTFNSPFKKQFTVKGTVLAQQNLPLLGKDSLAYYWRTKLANPLAEESKEWRLSSFSYIAGNPEGWAQIHFPQYNNDEAIGLVKDGLRRRISLKETITPISIKTFGANPPYPPSNVSVMIDGAEYNLTTQGFNCRANTINLIAFDRHSTVPYIGVYAKWYEMLWGGYPGIACGREPFVINSFQPWQMTFGTKNLLTYVDNVALGDSVVLYSNGDAQYALWPATAKTKLGELGISIAQIDALTAGEPVVIFARKGLAPGSALVFRPNLLPLNAQSLTVNKTITGRYTSGQMRSPLIGPATQWFGLTRKVSEVEPMDSVAIEIFGASLTGQETFLAKVKTKTFDLSGINAQQYPYLRIVYKAGDDVNLTASQLKHWIVTFTPAAEGLLSFKGTMPPLHVPEGSTWKTSYGFTNISDKPFTDSLTVRYEVFNNALRASDLKFKKIKAPLPGETSLFDISTPTMNKVGKNDVNVFVNPYLMTEQHYDNNTLELKDHLDVYRYSPVLDVTIDGRYVENNDYVSPNPDILVHLWDNNPFVFVTDTSSLEMYLKYPCTANCSFQRIYFSDKAITWTPGSASTSFQAHFRLHQLPEGHYTLFVRGFYANTGQETTYEINFRISYETTFTVLNPYPNPSHDKVYFKTILSGQDALDSYRLRIFTLDGKEVLNTYKTSGFHVGINEFTLDGKDTYGQELPNGIYLYRLTIKAGNMASVHTGKLLLNR